MPRTMWFIAIPATLLVMLAASRPAAQQDDAEPEFIERRYEVADLVDSFESVHEGEPELYPYGFGEEFPTYFWQTSGRHATYRFDDIEEIEELIAYLDAEDELESIDVAGFPDKHLVVRATERVQRRIAAAFELLRAYANTGIRIELRRLDSPPDSVVTTDGEGGTLIGVRNVAHGEYAQFSDITRSSITWGNSTSGPEVVPESGDIYWGNQWAVSPMLLPDGRIRLQAWHCEVRDRGIREMDTPYGVIQLPAAHLSATPGAATIENGGGLVFDSPGGPWLVTAQTDERIPNVVLEDGDFTIWNPAGALPAGWFTAQEYLKPPMSGLDVHLPQVLGFGNPPVTFPDSAPIRASEYIIDAMRFHVEGAAPLRVDRGGPLVFAATRPLWDEEDPATMEEGQRRVMKQLERATTGPEHHTLRLALLRLPRDTELPDTVLQGRGGDVDALKRLPDCEVLMERRISLASGQRADILDIELQNYLDQVTRKPGVDGELTGASTVLTWGYGIQVRISLAADGDIEAEAKWRHDSSLRTLELDGPNEGITIEEPEASDVEFRVTGSARELSSVQPAGAEHLSLFVLTREGQQ